MDDWLVFDVTIDGRKAGNNTRFTKNALDDPVLIPTTLSRPEYSRRKRGVARFFRRG